MLYKCIVGFNRSYTEEKKRAYVEFLLTFKAAQNHKNTANKTLGSAATTKTHLLSQG